MTFTRRNAEYDDARLVEQCLQGDQDAWKELVNRCYGAIAAIVRHPKWGFKHQDGEDLIQEALEELVKSLPNYKHQDQLRGFVQTLAFRQCTERLRKALALKRATDRNCEMVDTIGGERENPGAHIPIDQRSDPLGTLLANEQVNVLKTALQRLETECKKLIRMRFFEELSFPDMAEYLNLKENTVAVKLGRCVKKLRPYFASLL